MAVCTLSLFLLLSLAASEHEDPLVPQDPRAIAATLGGELWILEGQANDLLHVSKGGVFERVGAPLQPQLLAWSEADGLWLCSNTRLARRGLDGVWAELEIPPAADSRGLVALVPLAAGRAALVRNLLEAGAEVLFFDLETHSVTRRDVFAGRVKLSAGAADGGGGLWALLSFPDSQGEGGHAHFTGGEWTTWTTSGSWPKDAAPPQGTTLAGVSPEGVGGILGDRFFAAGEMTLFARGQAQLVEVPLDGASRTHDLGPSLQVLQSLTWDETTQSLLLLTGGSEWFGIGQRGPEFPLELTTLGGARVPVPMPAWLEDEVRPPGRLASAGGVTWAVLRGAVFRSEAGTWTTFVSAPLKQTLADQRAAGARDLLASLLLALLGASLALGLGGLSGLVRGEAWYATLGQTFAGSLLALAPGLVSFELSPFSHGWGVGGGMAIAFMGLIITVPATVLLAALGPWSLGERLFGPSVRPGRAFAGALLGALAGVVLGFALDAMLADSLVAFRYAFDLGVIGAAATLGYQFGNGGRAAR